MLKYGYFEEKSDFWQILDNPKKAMNFQFGHEALTISSNELSKRVFQPQFTPRHNQNFYD